MLNVMNGYVATDILCCDSGMRIYVPIWML